MPALNILKCEPRPLSEPQRKELVAFFGHPGRQVFEQVVRGQVADFMTQAANEELDSVEYPNMKSSSKGAFDRARQLRDFLNTLEEFASKPESQTTIVKVTN